MLKAAKFSMNRIPLDSIKARLHALQHVSLTLEAPAVIEAIYVPTFCRSLKKAQNQGKNARNAAKRGLCAIPTHFFKPTKSPLVSSTQQIRLKIGRIGVAMLRVGASEAPQ